MTEHQDDIPGPEDTTEEEISPAPSPRSSADPLIGTKIGSCTLKRIIGSGGMGTVYEAVQENPRRRVALKMMKRGITSRSATRRFEFESQTLARLQHPGVAQIYEAGTHDDGSGGVPYFVMEYVASAKPITQYADDKKLGTKDRLALFSKVCDAVQHGHLKGIVHRDLKPGNILVDSNGQPKVIDFGVARSTDSDMAVTTLMSEVGQLIGTLQYMSPEQCEADPSDIDGRSDVYALGVILYELLIGKPPYNLQRMAIHEAVRIIREEEPTKLSTIDRHLRGDIETIAVKALEKDRDRRYQSATTLEEDIQHYLSDEPISARPYGMIDSLRRIMRKHSVASYALLAFGLLVFIAIMVITYLILVIYRERAFNGALWNWYNTGLVSMYENPDNVEMIDEAFSHEIVFNTGFAETLSNIFFWFNTLATSVMILTSCLWVVFDSKRHQVPEASGGALEDEVQEGVLFYNKSTPVSHGLTVLFFWIFLFPAYLVKRAKHLNQQGKNHVPSTIFWVGFIIAILLLWVFNLLDQTLHISGAY